MHAQGWSSLLLLLLLLQQLLLYTTCVPARMECTVQLGHWAFVAISRTALHERLLIGCN
jgi:hypothetical protein